ncbi:MAG: 30S ribosomal protein S1 [Candidatus Cloacimonadota bacterium]|nr:MAG: 30S ribosomal protein S1 [Candidatus Cloacimonadota bacterium]
MEKLNENNEKKEEIKETENKEPVVQETNEQAEQNVTAEETKPSETETATEEKTEESSKEFAELFEESLGNIQNLEVGDKVEGEVINITDSYIFVSLGGKRDAYAEKADYLDKSGNLPYAVGDKIEGYIVKYTDTETLISRSLVSVNKELLHEAYNERIPVNGKVVSQIKGGYLLDISGVRAFCPLSQIDIKLASDTKQYIGQNYDFIIIDYQENGRNIVASRRAILEEEKNKLKEETLKKIAIGAVVKGKVTRLTSFGAFVDLGGVEGLIHISKFSWARVESPSEMLNIGDEVEAKVINIKGEKISLSLKDMQPDPFEDALRELKEGDVVSCRILRNQPFGTFVEIKPGVEGLIPISELALGRRINNPSEVVEIGDLVEAQILKINHEKKKISLSLKALQPDPWNTIDEYFSENDVVSGIIENVVNFGAFIKLRDGVTGLLPSSKIKLGGLKLDKTNIGEEIKVRIVKIDNENRRISLEPSELPETVSESKDDWNKYKKQKTKKELLAEDNPFSIL